MEHILSAAWRGRYFLASVVLILLIPTTVYLLVAQKWYRTEMVIVAADETQFGPITGQLGGLAALAGFPIADSTSTHALAVLQSKQLARDFVNDLSLITVFFADDWDKANGKWRSDNPADHPDERDAVDFFHNKVFSVYEDKKTGLVILRIDWTDPDAGQEWANELVKRTNEKMRQQALIESTANIRFLQAELASTSLVPLQQAIGALLENEVQRLMLARGKKDFAFQILDSANTDKEPIWPQPAFLLVIATMLATILGTAYLYVLSQLHEKTQ